MLHLFWKYCQRHCTKTYPISSAHKIGNVKSRSEPLVVLNKGKNATSCFSCSKRVFVIYFVPEMMHLLNGNSEFLRKQNFRVMISLISAIVSFTSAVSTLRWLDCCIHKSWGFPSIASLIIFGDRHRQIMQSVHQYEASTILCVYHCLPMSTFTEPSTIISQV